MATAFSLTDGTTTIQLFSSAVTILEYVQSQEEESGQGGLSTGNVSEDMTLLFFGGSASAIRTIVRDIEKMIIAAQRRVSRGSGPRVFLQAQMEGDTALWRSELFAGKLLIENIADEFWRGKVEGHFSFVRGQAWEGPETELSISSSGYGAATGGRAITNDGVGNWVQIDSSQVDGSIPGFVRIRLQNATGGQVAWWRVYIGNNAFASPTTFTAVIQGEATIGLGGGGTAGTSTQTITTSPVREYIWRFNASQMQAGGRWFRVIARINGYVSTPMLARLSIYDYYGIGRLWRGGEQLLTPTGLYTYDFGSVPIPPGNYALDYESVCLEMAIRTLTGTGTINLDYISLLGTDSFRSFNGIDGLYLNASDYAEFDDIEFMYHSIESGKKHPVFSPVGSPLMVFPNVTQRLHIVTAGDVTDTIVVRMWYRPARLTV